VVAGGAAAAAVDRAVAAIAAVVRAAAGAADVAEQRRQFVYGLHAITAVIDRAPERLLELWLAQARDDQRIRQLAERARAVGIRVQSVAPPALVKLLGEDVAHQGAVAAVRPLPLWDDDDLLTAVEGLTEPPFLLVLDGVTDPHNLGACLRTAEAAGVHALVIPRDRAASIDGVVRKVAAGAAEFVPVASVTNLARTLDALKARDIWVVGTDGEADQSLYAADLRRPLAMVLGAEGGGMRRLTRERCDFLVHIPMAGRVESLNVSVAAGVALFEARRQRLG
jgi:23S rRNA (guanosine2251-2'-O)-methyltransferase